MDEERGAMRRVGLRPGVNVAGQETCDLAKGLRVIGEIMVDPDLAPIACRERRAQDRERGVHYAYRRTIPRISAFVGVTLQTLKAQAEHPLHQSGGFLGSQRNLHCALLIGGLAFLDVDERAIRKQREPGEAPKLEELLMAGSESWLIFKLDQGAIRRKRPQILRRELAHSPNAGTGPQKKAG